MLLNTNECRALFESVQYTMLKFRQLKAMGITFDGPPRFIGDNEAIIRTMTGRKIPEKSKALKIKYLNIRKMYAEGKLILGWTCSQYNHADIGTKCNLTRETFHRHAQAIQLSRPILEAQKWYIP